jgi:hypothetical protein
MGVTMYINSINGEMYHSMYDACVMLRGRNISTPDVVDNQLLECFGIFPVQPTEQPDFNLATERLVICTPTLEDGVYYQVWGVANLTEAELSARAGLP